MTRWIIAVFLLVPYKYALSVEIPLNIGFGPAAFNFVDGFDADNTATYYGLKLDIAAVIDQKIIKKYKKKIPKKFRKAASKVKEAKVGYLLIPKSIIFASSSENSSVYGATWRPIGLERGIKLGPLSINLQAGLVLSYFYIGHETFSNSYNANLGKDAIAEKTDESTTRETETVSRLNRRLYSENDETTSEKIEVNTHFFRPGLSLGLNFELKATPEFLLSAGVHATGYIPQKIGGGVFSFSGESEPSLYLQREANFLLHIRIPVEV